MSRFPVVSGDTGFTGEPPTSGGSGDGGLIGGLLALGGSIYEGQVAKRNVDKTIQANKEQAAYAYSKELEMWNLMNQYNSPEAQMARYKAAGLNPNMIYGQGTPGNAQTLPRYNAPTLQYNYKPAVDLPRVLGLYQDFQMRQAQINNVKAQTENTKAKTLSENLRPALMQIAEKTGNQRLRELMTSYAPRMQQYANVAESGELKIQQQVQQLSIMKKEDQIKALDILRSGENLKMMSLMQENVAAENLFKKYRNEWMKEGITSSDNIFLRMIVRMMNEGGLGLDLLTPGVKKHMDEGMNILR